MAFATSVVVQSITFALGIGRREEEEEENSRFETCSTERTAMSGLHLHCQYGTVLAV
jgi:hypothetical protein